MKGKGKTERDDLRMRLEEAEETLRAIRKGEVDALVVSGADGDQVFTLKGADYPYRVFVETMDEGAVTLGVDGTILYCNRKFSEILQTRVEKLIGSPISLWIPPENKLSFESAFEKGRHGVSRLETFLNGQASLVPVYVSFYPLKDADNQAICMLVMDLTERKKAENALTESERQLRALSLQLLSIQETERRRIARELHDGLQQVLTAIKYKVEGFLQKVAQEETEIDLAPLQSVIPVIQDCVREVSRMQSNLRPSILDDLGILASISWLSRNFEEVSPGIRIERRLGIMEKEIPNALKMVIYRVLQETLNNVFKHSHADVVDISLQRIDRRIELSVHDNGQGFNLADLFSSGAEGKGLGLIGMRERAEGSGGTFQIQSIPGNGTTVRVSWPILGAELMAEEDARSERADRKEEWT